jgi:hypothetical protein
MFSYELSTKENGGTAYNKSFHIKAYPTGLILNLDGSAFFILIRKV